MLSTVRKRLVLDAAPRRLVVPEFSPMHFSRGRLHLRLFARGETTLILILRSPRQPARTVVSLFPSSFLPPLVSSQRFNRFFEEIEALDFPLGANSLLLLAFRLCLGELCGRFGSLGFRFCSLCLRFPRGTPSSQLCDSRRITPPSSPRRIPSTLDNTVLSSSCALRFPSLNVKLFLFALRQSSSTVLPKSLLF